MEDELDWLTRERQDLIAANRGKWVAIDREHNKVFASENLHDAITGYHQEHPNKEPWVFLIPREDEDSIALWNSLTNK